IQMESNIFFNIVLNDVKIYTTDKYSNKEFQIPLYSLNLIKSGETFNSKELFCIRNKIIEGEHKYSDNFNRTYITSYKDGKKNGKHESWYKDGIKFIECSYKDDKM